MVLVSFPKLDSVCPLDMLYINSLPHEEFLISTATVPPQRSISRNNKRSSFEYCRYLECHHVWKRFTREFIQDETFDQKLQINQERFVNMRWWWVRFFQVFCIINCIKHPSNTSFLSPSFIMQLIRSNWVNEVCFSWSPVWHKQIFDRHCSSAHSWYQDLPNFKPNLTNESWPNYVWLWGTN